MTRIISDLPTLRGAVAAHKAAGETVALVPTMGALHAGHMALVEAAKARATRVVVSIFVNPNQFGPNEDFSRYPRTLEADVDLLKSHGADMLWLPDVATMYPEGFASQVKVAGVSEGLCGAFRPGHFEGVATVVAKLLLQVMPDMALFGEKDYQQLCVIKRMVQDLNIATQIEGVPTLREADGLALSSRNRYLSSEERKIASNLNIILLEAINKIKNEYSFNCALSEAVAAVKEAGFTKLDYLECRMNDSLAPCEQYAANARLLVAAWLGNTRLIDNMQIG